jgi:predicted RNA-binding Zn ribbon-like protein
VRDHIAAAVHAARHGEQPAADALEGLNAAMRAAPAIQELSFDGTSVALVSRRQGSTGTRLAALLAEEAAEILADSSIRKVRVCEAEDCLMLFLPTHPRRRWCSATRCGNRTRVARYYQRHKAG